MKKVFLALTVLGVFAASAATDPTEKNSKNKVSKAEDINLSYAAAKKMKLTVLDDEKGSIDLKVIDKETGKQIADHSQFYKKSFALLIDMSEKKDGQYEFQIAGEDFTIKQDVFLSSMSQHDVAANITETGDRKYNVKVFHDDVPVHLSVTDADGKVVHKYVHTGKANFQQSIDLSDFAANEELYISIKGEKTNIYEAL